MNRRPGVLLSLLLLVPALAAAASPARSVQYGGSAYDVEDGAVLYRESHYVQRGEDGSGTRLVLYRCADGRPFARKKVTYPAGGSLVPEFTLEDARLGYREGVRRGAAGAEVFYRRDREQPERAATLPRAEGLVADAGFDDFVLRHWDALVRGETLRFPFLVPSDLDYIGFKVRKFEEREIQGEAAMVVRLSLGAWFGFMLPHIDVAYAVARRELLQFEGLSNIRDLDGDNLTARIEFPPAERAVFSGEAAGAAATQALVATCD